MEALVDVDQFRLWPGVSVPPAREASATAVLRQASALVRSYTGQTWETSVPDEVQGIVLQVAARVWTNPDGAVQRVSGPYQVRFSDTISAGLYLTDAERETLSRFRRTSGLQVVRTTRGDMRDSETVWVPTAPPPGPLFPFLDASDL